MRDVTAIEFSGSAKSRLSRAPLPRARRMSAHQQPSRSRPAFDQKWTEEEVAILRAKWSDVTVSNEDLPRFLRERSLKAARNMAHCLRLGPCFWVR